MKETHARLNISENEWRVMLMDFHRTLNNCGVPAKEQDELVAVFFSEFSPPPSSRTWLASFASCRSWWRRPSQFSAVGGSCSRITAWCYDAARPLRSTAMHHYRRSFSHVLRTSSGIMALLAMAATAQAQVGVLQGVVSGVPSGTVLPVFKGEVKVADIKVGADSKFSVALSTGVYTVKCPNGATPKVAALNGAANTNINCK
jgi:hypothetical protein